MNVQAQSARLLPALPQSSGSATGKERLEGRPASLRSLYLGVSAATALLLVLLALAAL